MSAMYERLASSMLSKRYIRGDSLVYGLGVAFLAYQGRVECYKHSGFHVLDGLGYVPPVEMEIAGIDAAAIKRAAVLHFNGERKPWGKRPFEEYVAAMGDWGQHVSPVPHSVAPASKPKRMDLVVLLSGPRTGTEWLAKVMTDDSERVCGALEERTAPHPESLMPFNVMCSNPKEESRARAL